MGWIMQMNMREAWISTVVAIDCCVLCWLAVATEAQVGGVAAAMNRTKLSTEFYGRSCPGVEQVVSSTMARHLQQDITSGAPLLRMFFHDCAVNVHSIRHSHPNRTRTLI